MESPIYILYSKLTLENKDFMEHITSVIKNFRPNQDKFLREDFGKLIVEVSDKYRTEFTQALNILSLLRGDIAFFNKYVNKLESDTEDNTFNFFVSIMQDLARLGNDQLKTIVCCACLHTIHPKLVDAIINHINNLNTEYNIQETPTDSWDQYFLNIAIQAARNSKCYSKHIGAVLVKDKSIIGTGYNGPPRGVPTCDNRWELDSNLKNYTKTIKNSSGSKCPRKLLGFHSGDGRHLCVSGHAERNALINSARMGISTKGAQLYLNCGIPCTECLVEIINAGIEEVVVTDLIYYGNTSSYLIEQSGLKVRKYHLLPPDKLTTSSIDK